MLGQTASLMRLQSNKPLRPIESCYCERDDQARAERAPSLDLAGAYGRGGRLLGDSLSGFSSAASAWLTLRVPLLTGGLVSSRMRQAEATARAERYQIEAASREARRTTDSAWASLTAAQRRLSATSDGFAAAT